MVTRKPLEFCPVTRQPRMYLLRSRTSCLLEERTRTRHEDTVTCKIDMVFLCSSSGERDIHKTVICSISLYI